MIRKSWYVAVIAGALLVPATAFGALFVSGRIGNLYAVGQSVAVSTPVTGDVYAVGGSLTLNSSVTGDMTAAGGTITVLAPVRGDVRVVGGTLIIGDTVDGDVVVFGGTITLLPGTIVGGDVVIMGGRVSFAGTVRGNVLVRAQNSFTLDPGTRIGGDLTYRAPHALALPTGVVGEVIYKPLKKIGFVGAEYGFKALFWATLAFLTAVKMLAYFGAVLLAVWVARRPLAALFQDMVKRWWPFVGRGLAYSVLVPIGMILLLMSVVGILPAVLLGLLYAGLLIAAKVFSGMFFGAWLHAKMRKHTEMRITWFNAIGGVLAYQLLGIVPVLGNIAQVLIFLAVFGVLTTRTQKILLNQ